MRFYKVILILAAAFSLAGCMEKPKPSTPLETLKSYTVAVKRKDITSMKLLLSDASIKMAQQQAREQNVTLDEIIKNETLITEDQQTFMFRNEKIEGERATIELKNSFNTWDTIPFVLEEGIWKIDKQALANQMLQQNELDMQELDKRINQGRIP